MQHPSQQFTDQIKRNIDNALKRVAKTPLAAFDADGTCWFSDVGRDFFDYQIEKNFFVDQKYTVEDFEKIESQSIEKALFWLAEILAGFTLDEVRNFTKKFHQDKPPVYIPHQKEIISHLKSSGVDVYIVTASVKWTVEAAAAELEIDEDHILGVESQVDCGVITNKKKGVLTWHDGKRQAFLEHTGGRAPFFVAGNTMSDVPLMQVSTHLKQIMRSAEETSSCHQGECKALALAKESGWHYLDYTRGEFK